MRRCIRHLNRFLLADSQQSPNNIYYNKRHLASESYRTLDQIQSSAKARDRRFIKACIRRQKSQGIELTDAANQVRDKWRRVWLRRGNVDLNKMSLEEYLYPSIDRELKHKLTIELTHVESSKSKREREEELRLLQKYQLSVHNEGSEDWSMRRYCDFLVDSPIITEPIRGFGELSDEIQSCNSTEISDDLAKHIVLDEMKHQQNGNHLIQPPPLPTRYGTYHCCYRLDGKLIAVGVLDILPKSISTCYLFYDPDYAFLNLGIYTALNEISLVRRMSRCFVPSDTKPECALVHYYLGFYVHKCVKMKYKLRFKPSYILCDETNEYVPTDFALSKLTPDIDYAVFSDTAVNQQLNNYCPVLEDVHRISVYTPVTAELNSLDMFSYLSWLRRHLNHYYVDILITRILLQYIKVVGPELFPRMILKIWSVHNYLMRYAESQDSEYGEL